MYELLTEPVISPGLALVVAWLSFRTGQLVSEWRELKELMASADAAD